MNPSPYRIAQLAGLTPSPAQAAILKSFAGEPLTREELAVWRKITHTTFAKPRPGGYSELWIVGGRQGGKDTHIAAPIVVASTLQDPTRWHLVRGATAKAVIVGAKLDHCQTMLDACDGCYEAIGIPHRKTDLRISLPGLPVEVQAWTADEQLRSMTACCVAMTEPQLLPYVETAAGRDVDVFASAKPMLVTTGGPFVSIGNAWVRRGVHHETTMAHLGKTKGNVLAAVADSWTLNPTITEARTHELERDRRRWAREYKAEASEDDDTFLHPGDVRACVDRGIEERPPQSGVQYVIGFDLGLRRDRSAIVVAHRELRNRDGAPPLDCVVVDCVRIFQPQPPDRLHFDHVVSVLANLSHRYGKAKVLRDSFSGDAVHAHLKQLGVRSEELPMSSPAQAARFELLAQRVRSGALRLLDGHAGGFLVHELIDLRMKLSQMGRTTIAAPERSGSYDDAADACALAVEGCKSLAATGGDIRCEYSVQRTDANVQIVPTWKRTVIKNGVRCEIPCGPPVGTPAWRQLRREQRAQGIVIPGEPSPDDDEPSTFNIPVRHD